MGNSSEKPIYILEPGHPIIDEWRPWFEQFERVQGNMVFSVDPSDIQNNNVGKIQQMAMALQHFPHLIEKMVFAIKFNFNLAEGMKIARSEDWKRDPAIRQWLFKISEAPMMTFLIKDSAARFFMIADDILSQVEGSALMLDEEQTKIISGRIFMACYSFFIYCHNTGFQPDIYIDGLLAEHDVSFTVEDVKYQYEEDIKNGTPFGSGSENR